MARIGDKYDDRYNGEGYPSPVEFELIKKENDLERKVAFLIKVLKFIIDECGFDLVNRIEIRDRDSGRFFK